MTFIHRTFAAAVAMTAAAFASVCAARTAGDFFVEAPPEVVPLLDTNTRLDMRDYFSHGFDTPSKNAFGGMSRVLSDNDSRIEVQISRDATLQIALVPLKNDTVIAVIETVLTPVADSDLRLYTRTWKPIPVAGMPKAEAFMTTGRKTAATASEMPDIWFMRIDYDPEGQKFIMHNTTPGYYSAADMPEALSQMKPSLSMRFDGKKLTEVRDSSK